MSIKNQIATLETAGHLVRIAPRSRRYLKRRMFLTRELARVLSSENSAVAVLGGSGYVIAVAERWVRGERIYKGYLKRLEPPPFEIWEIRVTQPTPQWRVFCRFAYPDTIIATHIYSRQILGPKTVKRKRSQAWQNAMDSCESTWQNLFPQDEPLANGKQPSDYISEPVDDFKI